MGGINNIFNMMNNPMMKMLLNSNNPEQALEQLLSQNPNIKNNPLMQNALKMFHNGDTKGIETMARNLMSENGQNADEIINKLKGMKG